MTIFPASPSNITLVELVFFFAETHLADIIQNNMGAGTSQIADDIVKGTNCKLLFWVFVFLTIVIS